MTTGAYYQKSDPKRHVTSANEGPALAFILPTLTRPYDMSQDRKLLRPRWEEEIVYNEDYAHFVRPACLLLFELLDLAPGVEVCAG